MTCHVVTENSYAKHAFKSAPKYHSRPPSRRRARERTREIGGIGRETREREFCLSKSQCHSKLARASSARALSLEGAHKDGDTERQQERDREREGGGKQEGRQRTKLREGGSGACGCQSIPSLLSDQLNSLLGPLLGCRTLLVCIAHGRCR